VYLGDFAMAKNFNRLAGRLGCPQVQAVDGERLSDAMRARRRCLRRSRRSDGFPLIKCGMLVMRRRSR
jgi:hypothetical protein